MRDKIKDEMLGLLYQQWVVARRSKLVPFRSAIDLSAMDGLLSNLSVFEFISAEETYLCRLAGPKVQQAFKADLIGSKIQQMFSAEIAALYESYLDTARTSPAVIHGLLSRKVSDGAGNTKKSEILILPLSNADGDIVQLICAQVFDYDLEQEAFDFEVDEFKFEVLNSRDLSQ